MHPINKQERILLDFFSSLTDSDLDGHAHFFIVRNLFPLPQPMLLQPFGNRQFQGFVGRLGEGRPGRLAQQCVFPDWAGNVEEVYTTVRIPHRFVSRYVAREFTSVLLPQLRRRPFQFSWERLGLPASSSRRSAAPCSRKSEGQPERGVLSFQTAMTAADELRLHALTIHLGSFEGIDRYRAISHAVRALQAFQDEQSPVALQKTIMQARGEVAYEVELNDEVQAVPPGQRGGVAYKVPHMLKTFCLASLLNTSSSIPRVLRTAVQLLVIPSLRTMMDDCFNCFASFVPLKSTISRWRVLIDVAMMLSERDKCSADHAPAYVRYLQADSSKQHGREFQHMVVLSIEKQRLPHLLLCANSLIAMWSQRLI